MTIWENENLEYITTGEGNYEDTCIYNIFQWGDIDSLIDYWHRFTYVKIDTDRASTYLCGLLEGNGLDSNGLAGAGIYAWFDRYSKWVRLKKDNDWNELVIKKFLE
jgi:hypothetical protein